VMQAQKSPGANVRSGQTRKSDSVWARSACPSTADMRRLHRHVGFVPRTEVERGVQTLLRSAHQALKVDQIRPRNQRILV
jgi:hypothetical protein